MVVEFDKSGRIKRLITLAKGITNKNIQDAIIEFESLGGAVHTFNHSTGYDLLVGNTRYPPKAIFALALKEILSLEILSKHFSGGIDSPCFRTLERLGYDIVEKARPSASDGLEIYNAYTRKEVKEIFEPEGSFTPGAGQWGLSGIISNKPRQDDFIFFVTLEEGEGNDYDDYLTEDGVIFWKSQTRHKTESPVIKTLVSHNEELNTIYLFMRQSKKEAYTFLGPLAFRGWVPNSNEPVHFQWNIINWPLPSHVETKFLSFIKPAISFGFQKNVFVGKQLIDSPVPKVDKQSRKGKKGKVSSDTDWAKREQRNRELGLAGEQAVLAFERSALKKASRNDLAMRVEHTASVDSSAGYDVKSFKPDGTVKYIEVKTTTGSKKTPFYISRNEVEVSKELKEQYWIYRLYDFEQESPFANFYAICGDVESRFELTSSTYRAIPK